VTSGPVIEVRGIRIYAKHGVFDFEKLRDQLFIVDIWVRIASMPIRDDLDTIVDYAGLVEIARRHLQGTTRNLIETVAEAILAELMGLPLVAEARVTLHKPQVDLGAPIADVSVTLSRTSP
jgi:dihydroneopterin aldolase